VQRSDKYDVSDFKFEDITAKDKKGTFDTSFIDGVEVKNVSINGKTW